MNHNRPGDEPGQKAFPLPAFERITKGNGGGKMTEQARELIEMKLKQAIDKKISEPQKVVS